MSTSKRPWTRGIALLALLWLAAASPAQAYIDPNAGGMLFQLLAPVMAAAVGAWLYLRRWISDWARRAWRRITGRSPE